MVARGKACRQGRKSIHPYNQSDLIVLCVRVGKKLIKIPDNAKVTVSFTERVGSARVRWLYPV